MANLGSWPGSSAQGGDAIFELRPVRRGRFAHRCGSWACHSPATRPPGLVTRAISASIRSASTCCITVRDIAMSMLPSAKGCTEALPFLLTRMLGSNPRGKINAKEVMTLGWALPRPVQSAAAHPAKWVLERPRCRRTARMRSSPGTFWTNICRYGDSCWS